MNRWPTLPLLATALVAALVTTGAAVAAEKKYTLDRCAEQVRDHPEDYVSYRCYWSVSRRGQTDEAVRALEALLAIDPANPYPQLVLAHIERDRGRYEPTTRLYRAAAEEFAKRGDLAWEVNAWICLAREHRVRQRFAETKEALENALAAANRSGDPELVATSQVHTASLHIAKSDYGAALRYLQKAEHIAFPDGPLTLRAKLLDGMALAYRRMGLKRKALDAHRRQLELQIQIGDPVNEALCRFNMATLAGEIDLEEGTLRLEDYIRSLEKVAELAAEIGSPLVEVGALLSIGEALNGERGIKPLERALELCRRLELPREVRGAMLYLGESIVRADPARREEGLRWIDASIDDARAAGDLREIAFGRIARATVLAGIVERGVWIEEFRRAIEAVERLRDLQPDGQVRAGAFQKWAHLYYRFSGLLLRHLETSPDPEHDIHLALRVIERMRSRVLLDELDRADAHPRYPEDNPDVRRRTEVLEAIASVQKRLGDPSLAEAARRVDLEELDRLEREEMALRDAIARADPGFAALRSPEIPEPREIRDRLAPDLAILSFQLSTRAWTPGLQPYDGGAWAILLTREGVEAFPLEDEDVLEKEVRIYLGLCRRGDGSEAKVGARLFDRLLAGPLGVAGPSVRRLVIVPDGCLHRLPFAALRSGPGGEPLGVTHEVTRVPSITLWSRWRTGSVEEEASPLPSSVLALADPAIGTGGGGDETRTAEPWLEGLRLGPLPRARREARGLVRQIGGASKVLAGAEASERSVKLADLEEFGIVHFAAHAVVDDESPGRSAVLLAPGGDGEDGFLQMREIVDLDFGGKAVILSACNSASGTVLHGEGVLSLARAFFQAGAKAVVASLWPMRDDETAVFMDEFSRQIGRGQSLAGALARARAYRVAKGDPVTAWAGLVLLGDGDMVPVPGGRAAGLGRGGWILLIAVALVLAVTAWLLRRRFLHA